MYIVRTRKHDSCHYTEHSEGSCVHCVIGEGRGGGASPHRSNVSNGIQQTVLGARLDVVIATAAGDTGAVAGPAPPRLRREKSEDLNTFPYAYGDTMTGISAIGPKELKWQSGLAFLNSSYC